MCVKKNPRSAARELACWHENKKTIVNRLCHCPKIKKTSCPHGYPSIAYPAKWSTCGMANACPTGSLKTLSSQIYSASTRILYEIIQNADDCSFDDDGVPWGSFRSASMIPLHTCCHGCILVAWLSHASHMPTTCTMQGDRMATAWLRKATV